MSNAAVVAWIIEWPDGARGRIPNRGPEWEQLAMARKSQGATVTEIRKPQPVNGRDEHGA